MTAKLRSIVNAFLYLLLFLGSAALAAVIFTLFGLPGLAAPGAAVISVAALYAIARRRRKDISEWFTLKQLSPKELAVILALTVPATFIVQCVQFILPPRFLTETPQFELPYGIFSALSIMVFSPVAEEVVFRGFIFKELNSRFSAAAAVAIASLLFSGLHSGAVWSLMAMLISVYYSVLFVKFKSIYAPVAAHVTSNCIAVAFNLLFASAG